MPFVFPVDKLQEKIHILWAEYTKLYSIYPNHFDYFMFMLLYCEGPIQFSDNLVKWLYAI
jgi:hypothetical protein